MGLQQETLLQIACCDYLNMQYKKLLYFHTPNGGLRTKAEARIFRQMGVKAGIPDLLIIDSFWLFGDQYKGMAIELKAKSLIGKPKQPSKSQKEMLVEFAKRGFFISVVDNISEFIVLIEAAYKTKPLKK